MVVDRLLTLVDGREEEDIATTALTLAMTLCDNDVIEQLQELMTDAPIYSESDDEGWPGAARVGYAYLFRIGRLETMLPRFTPERLMRRASEDMAARIARRLGAADRRRPS